MMQPVKFFVLGSLALLLAACAGKDERRPVEPPTTSSSIPWNPPTANDFAGPFGSAMMPRR